MPVTRAPRCAIASARMPPPQSTSSTFLPLRPRCASIHPRRSGLISCSGLNSPCGSHQRCASELNLASSAGSAFMQRFSQIKSPAGAGLAGAGEGLRLPRADDLDLDAAIRRQAGHQLLVAAMRSRRSEEHTSELQSLTNLVCRLLLEKKNNKNKQA